MVYQNFNGTQKHHHFCNVIQFEPAFTDFHIPFEEIKFLNSIFLLLAFSKFLFSLQHHSKEN